MKDTLLFKVIAALHANDVTQAGANELIDVCEELENIGLSIVEEE